MANLIRRIWRHSVTQSAAIPWRSASVRSFSTDYTPPPQKMFIPPPRVKQAPRSEPVPEPTHRVPMTQPFPGTPPLLSDARRAREAPETQITQLPNGVRVASEENPSVAAAFGVFVECGSIYETDETHGLCRMLERMAYKKTKRRSTKDIVALLEDVGGNILSSSSREVMTYSGEVVRESLPATLGAVAECIGEPEFDESDLEEQKAVLLDELEQLDKHPQGAIFEMLHQLAFRGPLGRTMIVSEERIAAMTAEDLRAFHRQFFRPDRIVVSLTGPTHSEAVALVQEKFGHLQRPAEPNPPHPTSEYVGGWHLMEMDPEYKPKHPNDPIVTHMMIAWEACRADSDDMYALAAVNTLLGGGGSFSSGGPGKGMYSRLYRGVLCGNDFIEDVSAFFQAYHDTGIFGVYLQAKPPQALLSLQILAGELISVCHEISDEQLLRAKNQLKAQIFMGLEARAIAADDIGRQIVAYGKRHSARAICDRIDALTARDLQDVLKRVFQTRPTFLAYGMDVKNARLPPLEDIASFFKENSVSE